MISIMIMLIWYALPWMIALFGGHKKVNAILVSSIFINWTIIGWIYNLVWSIDRYDP